MVNSVDEVTSVVELSIGPAFEDGLQTATLEPSIDVEGFGFALLLDCFEFEVTVSTLGEVLFAYIVAAELDAVVDLQVFMIPVGSALVIKPREMYI